MLMNYTKGLVDAFEFVILLATLTTLVPYAFSAAAQAWLWLVEPEAFKPKHLVRDTVIAALAFAYSVWAIAGAGDDIVTKGFVLLLLPASRSTSGCAGGSSASCRAPCSPPVPAADEPTVRPAMAVRRRSAHPTERADAALRRARRSARFGVSSCTGPTSSSSG